MHLDTSTIVTLSACEFVALLVIAHLWFRKRRMRVIPRLLWTVVLLVPLLGVLIYGLIRLNPDEHSDRLGEGGAGAL